MKRKNDGWFLAMPAVTGFIIFYFAPFILTLWYSVSFGIGEREFVGLENYRDIWKNEMFRLAMKNTAKFMVLGIPSVLILALLIALIVEKLTKGSHYFRLAFLYPFMVPVASTVMVVEIFLSERGILNSWLARWGAAGEDWTNSPQAFWILMLLFLWKNAGYHILLFFAGLKMIPREYYENAEMDGASGWDRFAKITMPLLMPILFFNIVIAIMNSFKCFREAFLISGIHPHDSIYMIQHFMNNNFENLNYQRISSSAVMLFTVIVISAGMVVLLCEIRKGKEKL